MGKGFDEYASLYDAWFLDNINVLRSEVNLVASTLRDAGRVLSVGCGSGLFEKIMREEHDIDVRDGIEPSAGMAAIARKRGMTVEVATAEEASFGDGCYDTILFNGSPSYIPGLAEVVDKAFRALRPGGRIVLVDVPKESGRTHFTIWPRLWARGIIRCSKECARPIRILSSLWMWPTGALRPKRRRCLKTRDSRV